MAWITAIVCSGLLFIIVHEHAARLPRDQRGPLERWFFGWTIKGLVVPFALWAFFNSDILDDVPSLVMSVDLARGPAHAEAFRDALGVGLFVISSYWTALTSGWLLTALYERTENPHQFRSLAITWSAVAVPIGLLIIGNMGPVYAGVAGALWFMPLLQGLASLAPERTRKPLYSRAIAKMHSDKFDEAEAAVIEELEKSEDDFEGWMMLAELYALHFHDLAGAENTIRDTCAQPATTPSQQAVAWNKLADWRLELADDPAGARRALEEICRMTPPSHMAMMARRRIEQLPTTREEWLERKQGKTFHLPALSRDFDDPDRQGPPAPPPDEAILRAKRLVERLQKNPNEAGPREELARLLAEPLRKTDAAFEQLELLLTMPNQPPEKRSEWLALTAAWQLKYKRDEPAARQILDRILREYPQTAQAFAAQRRLNLLDIEAKMRAARANPPIPPRISLLPG